MHHASCMGLNYGIAKLKFTSACVATPDRSEPQFAVGKIFELVNNVSTC